MFGRPFVKRFAICCRSVVCLSRLSVTLVYCGQTVGRIQIKLGMQVGLVPNHTVLDGNPGTPPPKGLSPQVLAHICCGQMARWIKMPLGRKVGLDPRDIMFDDDQLPLPKKRAEPPIFGPYLLCSNGWMDLDVTYVTWYGGRRRPKRHCVEWGSNSPPEKGVRVPNFRPM